MQLEIVVSVAVGVWVLVLLLAITVCRAATRSDEAMCAVTGERRTRRRPRRRDRSSAGAFAPDASAHPRSRPRGGAAGRESGDVAGVGGSLRLPVIESIGAALQRIRGARPARQPRAQPIDLIGDNPGARENPAAPRTDRPPGWSTIVTAAWPPRADRARTRNWGRRHSDRRTRSFRTTFAGTPPSRARAMTVDCPAARRRQSRRSPDAAPDSRRALCDHRGTETASGQFLLSDQVVQARGRRRRARRREGPLRSRGCRTAGTAGACRSAARPTRRSAPRSDRRRRSPVRKRPRTEACVAGLAPPPRDMWSRQPPRQQRQVGSGRRP